MPNYSSARMGFLAFMYQTVPRRSDPDGIPGLPVKFLQAVLPFLEPSRVFLNVFICFLSSFRFSMFCNTQVAPDHTAVIFSNMRVPSADPCAVFPSTQVAPEHTCVELSNAQVGLQHTCAVPWSTQVTPQRSSAMCSRSKEFLSTPVKCCQG